MFFLLFVLSIKIYIFATIKALCLKERLITFFTNTINIIFMKKFYSLFILFALVVSANAQQQEPVITLTYTADGTEHELDFGSAVAEENIVSIDWGDGTIVEAAKLVGVYDNYDVKAKAVTGTPKGEGKVKIYATKPLNDFECTSNVKGTGVTALDVSKATELVWLYANGNKLTELDLSQNTKLNDVDLSNNLLTSVKLPSSVTKLNLQNNKLNGFDASALTNLTKLMLTQNKIVNLDLSHNTKLRDIYALNCEMETLNLGNNTTAGLYVSVNNNNLKTLDLTANTGLKTGRLFAMNNRLTELKYTEIKTANISNNYFTLATLPTKNIKTLFYAPQEKLQIDETSEKTVDLSAQSSVDGEATKFTWHKKDGTALVAGTDYTEVNGVFTFLADHPEGVYCEMTNAKLPKFSGKEAFTTTLTKVTGTVGINAASVVSEGKVDIFTLDGKRVAAEWQTLTPGVYVVRQAGKTMKVVK